MIQTLDVFLWNMKVGSLVTYKEKYNDKACFYFDDEFLRQGYDIAPLRASIHSAYVKNGLPIYADNEKLFGGLPSFIADSLPDHWGNKVFNEWAKLHNISSRNLSVLDRLAYIGRRGMGALEFVPSMAEDMEQPFKVEIADLYRLAQATSNEARKFKTVLQPDLMMESLFKVGTSAGGRHPKAIINLNPKTNECYSGQVATPISGFIPMIIKFDEHINIPTTRIEYSYYLMAQDAGLKMMPSYILEGETSTHFLTERYDRVNNKKVHTQTLAAMNPLSDSYEDLFDVACRIGINPAELSQLFLLMTMNVLSGNIDDHSKNFSFLMALDGVWHITPAYDFSFSVNTSAPGYINRHCLTVNNKNFDIEKGDLLQIAKRFNIKCADSIINQAIGVTSNYAHYAQQAGLSNEWTDNILKEINYRIERVNS